MVEEAGKFRVEMVDSIGEPSVECGFARDPVRTDVYGWVEVVVIGAWYTVAKMVLQEGVALEAASSTTDLAGGRM